MVNLTISLSDETVRRLRKAVRDRYAGKKGALSGLIEESLLDKLDALDTPQPSQTFKAMKGGRLVAEAADLDTLARKLEQMNVDPRSVRIISSKKLAPIVRTGLRGRGI
ncbi:MAG: hypothetical protein JRN52_04735 [Nitrososphaerota archaeon]|nr:hypothetical protein [Nitrososphaerota archaeon]